LAYYRLILQKHNSFVRLGDSNVRFKTNAQKDTAAAVSFCALR